MDDKKLLPVSIIILAISVVIASIWVGQSLKSFKGLQTTSTTIHSITLNLSQVAEYLNMSEAEVRGIIKTEKNMLNKSGVFHGKSFPYFVINKKQYFIKSEIDEWLKEVSIYHTEYDTKSGWILR